MRSPELVPAAGWLRTCRRAWLRPDVVGGITAGLVVVPQAMAYATIADLPVQVGLYTCMVPMAVYTLLGGSRILSVSTTSTIAHRLHAARAAGVAADSASTDDALDHLATLVLLTGVVLLLARLFRLGPLIDNITEAIITGLKVGVGPTVAAAQLPKLRASPPTRLSPGRYGIHRANQLGAARHRRRRPRSPDLTGGRFRIAMTRQ